MNTAVQEIVALSRHYGAGHDWVIAGGGNTSIKDGDILWIKASGTTLGSITEEQFVAMDRRRLAAIWEAEYPADTEEREARALADLMAARRDPAGTLRPSVETMMHALFPQRLVVHTHPTILNGVTCSRDGAAAATRLFGDEALWIPTINPGYTLAVDMHRRVGEYRTRHGAAPRVVIMQNHGLVVAGETPEEIHDLHNRIVHTVRDALRREPETEPTVVGGRDLDALAVAVVSAIQDLAPEDPAPVAEGFFTPELQRRAASTAAMAPVASAFSPDHIVYAGHRPCYVDGDAPTAIAAAVRAFHAAEGTLPRIVVVRDRGAVAVAPTARKTEVARLLFLDALKVAAYAESFGGSRFMPAEQIDFVRNWEVEKFREKQSTG